MYSEDKETTNNTENKRIVLCAANAYEQKYWFNPVFDKIPDGIKDELRDISVLFTQEAGGIFILAFDEDGILEPDTMSEEDDITYDSVSAGLLTGEVRRRRAELFRMLELYYKIVILHENAADLLLEED